LALVEGCGWHAGKSYGGYVSVGGGGGGLASELGTSARELLIGIAPVEMARFEMA
jgi:hypothetical protein